MAKRAFILGGTGQIGWATAARLLDAGWDVAVGHRGRHRLPSALLERGARSISVDRDQPGALAAALGDGADAVIDAIAFARARIAPAGRAGLRRTLRRHLVGQRLPG